MTKKWQSDKKKEFYYRKAKREEYRSRASYKLKQLNQKFRLIKKGDRLLDLGAAPGGWMQVAGEIVGEKGTVVGVDLESIKPFEKTNIHPIQGDLTSKRTLEEIKNVSPQFDVVISDASPDISGVWEIDHYNSITLTRKALQIAVSTLKDGGNFLVKVFQGGLTKEFSEEVKREFEYTKVSKPPASRQKSSEVYIIGRGLLRTPVKRGDTLQVEIIGQGKEGEGYAKIDDYKIYVEKALPGEVTTIRVKKVKHRFATAVKTNLEHS